MSSDISEHFYNTIQNCFPLIQVLISHNLLEATSACATQRLSYRINNCRRVPLIRRPAGES